MQWRRYLIAVLLISTSFIACKKAFTPDIVNSPKNYLVVEGYINTSGDSTIFKLSRTTQISDKAGSVPEYNASVTVETEDGTQYYLQNTGNAIYTTNLVIPFGVKCRLHIHTADNKDYISDYVENLNNPPIDSIGHSIMPKGIQFYTYNHDPTNNVRYFRWEYSETWEYSSYYQSTTEYVNQQMVPRTTNILYCWMSHNSNDIFLGSSEKLSKAVIDAMPIAYIDVSTGKLAIGYSIFVKQYALTKEAYQYWQQVKKNTEELGSIFDAQPSEIHGNIRNAADPDEPVIGYISAGNVTTKRFTIGYQDIPLHSDSYYPPPTIDFCSMYYKGIGVEPLASLTQRLDAIFNTGLYTPVFTQTDIFTGKVTGYTYDLSECVDCRAKMYGGYNTRPSYWPSNLP